MSESDFAIDLESNDDLSHRVREVLTDIYLKSPLDIQTAKRRVGSASDDLRIDSLRLLYYYQRVSPRRRPVAFFLESSINNPLRAVIRTKSELEDGAADSIVYRTALAIIEEFMACLECRERLRNHKFAQRTLLNKNRVGLFQALVLRDGKHCAHCKSKRKKLLIDHIKPVAKYGITELVNLQLLCFSCNSKKSETLNEE